MFWTPRARRPGPSDMRPLTAADRDAVAALDARVTGEDRALALDVGARRRRGHARTSPRSRCARRGRRCPILARDPDAGAALLRAVLAPGHPARRARGQRAPRSTRCSPTARPRASPSLRMRRGPRRRLAPRGALGRLQPVLRLRLPEAASSLRVAPPCGRFGPGPPESSQSTSLAARRPRRPARGARTAAARRRSAPSPRSRRRPAPRGGSPASRSSPARAGRSRRPPARARATRGRRRRRARCARSAAGRGPRRRRRRRRRARGRAATRRCRRSRGSRRRGWRVSSSPSRST